VGCSLDWEETTILRVQFGKISESRVFLRGEKMSPFRYRDNSNRFQGKVGGIHKEHNCKH